MTSPGVTVVHHQDGNRNMDARYRIAELATMLEHRYSDRPIRLDRFDDSEALNGWSYLNQAYPIVEMALGLLTDHLGTRSHDIGKLFAVLSDASPLVADKIEEAVWEYGAFYNVNIEEHTEFRSAVSFLDCIDKGRDVMGWRYWPVEGGELKPMWSGLLVEIAGLLGSALLRDVPDDMFHQIACHIGRAVRNPRHWVDTLNKFEVDSRALVLELEDWREAHGGLLTAFTTYSQEGMEPHWSDALETLLCGAHREALRSENPEVTRFITKLTDTGGTTHRKRESHGTSKLRPDPKLPVPRLVTVEAGDPYMLRVEFDDGNAGLVDMHSQDGDLPAVWQTLEGWADVRLEHGVPVWRGWYDACPYGLWRRLVEQH